MIDAVTKTWVRTRADETAAEQGCRFEPERAERVRRFFRQLLRHSKGEWAGQPFELLEWQWRDVFAPVFGWVRRDGTRRFNQVYVEIPKKNGKSTMAAGVGLYMLVGDGEAGAEVFSTAVTRDQAAIVHDEAINMVKASRALSKRLKVNASTRAIYFPLTKSYYKALASGVNASEGKNPHCIIADEIHAWTGPGGRGFFDSLRYGGAARRQPLLWMITTAGSDTQTVCHEKHEYALDILRGTVREDTSFFPYVRAAEPSDDLDRPEVWRKANPSMGLTIREDRFEQELGEAKKKPAAWNAFRRYRFNQWVTGTNPALAREDWEACREEFTEAELEGQECWAALDMSRVRDMTALPLLFRGKAPGEYRLLVWFFLPKGTLDRPETPAEFRAWARAGYVTETDGDVTDYAVVEEKLVELAGRFQVRELAFDPHFAEELTQRVEARTGVPRVAFAQTITAFAGPTAEFERLVVAHQLRHDGNPCLAWQAGNVEFWTDRNNNKRPVKPGNREVKKVDGIVAAIMALGRAMQTQESAEPRVLWID